MLRVENNNKEVLEFVSAKLQRDNSKLFSKIPQKEKTEVMEKIVDGMTLGTDRNRKVLEISAVPSGAFVVVGLLQSIAGLISYIPTIEQPHGEEAIRFFERARNFGESAMRNGASNFSTGLVLLAIPAGVEVISFATRIHRFLVDARKTKIKNNNVVVQLIDDLLEPSEEEDKTLEFASKFIKKVDISGNSKKMNLEILKYLAYYRGVLRQKETGEKEQKDVDFAYDVLMTFLKETKQSKEASEDYKHSRYLNILINEYEDQKQDDYVIEGIRTL